MTGIPPQAITPAAEWLHDADCVGGDTKTCGRWQAALGKRGVSPAPHLGHIEFYRERAIGALDAAAPFLAEDGQDAARDRATETNAARRGERERVRKQITGDDFIRQLCTFLDDEDALDAAHMIADLLRKEATDAA